MFVAENDDGSGGLGASRAVLGSRFDVAAATFENGSNNKISGKLAGCAPTFTAGRVSCGTNAVFAECADAVSSDVPFVFSGRYHCASVRFCDKRLLAWFGQRFDRYNNPLRVEPSV